MYEAIICKLKNIRPHPNAHSLNLVSMNGYQIVIGKNHTEGQLGVFFPVGGKLTEEYLYNNNLYRHSELNKDKTKSGLFKDNGRIESVKLRGEKSDGFWMPIESLEWAGKTTKLKEGDCIDSIGGKIICEKYVTKATRNKVTNSSQKKKIKNKEKYKMLIEHYDTKQLRNHIRRIPEGALVYITEKLHGTSGRTGRIKTLKELTKFQTFTNRFLPIHETTEWKYVSGTRRTILTEDSKGFYEGTEFRQRIHADITDSGLRRGETLYYEIVGYTEQGAPLMGNYNAEDKYLQELYGKKITFSYGCEPGEYKIYVYRITMTNEDLQTIEYSWAQVEARCSELGLKTVPLLKGPLIYSTPEKLLKIASELSDGECTIDSRHPREGVVLRIEDKRMFEALKWKGDSYCTLEGIRLNDPNFVDAEDVE